MKTHDNVISVHTMHNSNKMQNDMISNYDLSCDVNFDQYTNSFIPNSTGISDEATSAIVKLNPKAKPFMPVKLSG